MRRNAPTQIGGQSGSLPFHEKVGNKPHQFSAPPMSSRSPALRRNQREVFRRAKATAAGNISKNKTAK